MSDNIMQQFYKELQKQGDRERELYQIKRMFDWPIGKDGFLEHMQKWSDAQPLTNVSVIEKLDELSELAEDTYNSARNLEDETESAQAAIEECSYYEPSAEAMSLQTKIQALKDEIENPKEQAEADMNDCKGDTV